MDGVAVPVPDAVENLLQEIDELEHDLNLKKLMPELVGLVKDVRKALSDGSISLWEMFTLGKRLVRIVKTAQRH